MVRPPRPNRGGAFEKWTVRLFVPALFLALFTAMYSVAGPRVDWRAWFDGPERGAWRAITIDGLDVSEDRMSIIVADGEIRGGRNGCNSWGYTGEVDPQTGEREMMSTLAGCIDKPELSAYYAIGHHRADLRLLTENQLEVSYLGTTGIFRRWTDQLDQAERATDEREMEAARRAEPNTPSPTYPAQNGAPTAIPRPPPPRAPQEVLPPELR